MNCADSVWLFDVDGTLIGSVRSDRLRPGAERLIRTLCARGKTLVVWSAGGADYAERMMARFGLDGFVSAFYSKQARGHDGRYTIDHFLPEHWPGTIVDDAAHEAPIAPRVLDVSQFLGSNQHDKGLDEALRLAGAGANGATLVKSI